jgi:hypothetical protein
MKTQTTAHKQDTLGTFSKITKTEGREKSRSFDGGKTWHKTTSGAFWAAYHSGNLIPVEAA